MVAFKVEEMLAQMVERTKDLIDPNTLLDLNNTYRMTWGKGDSAEGKRGVTNFGLGARTSSTMRRRPSSNRFAFNARTRD